MHIVICSCSDRVITRCEGETRGSCLSLIRLFARDGSTVHSSCAAVDSDGEIISTSCGTGECPEDVGATVPGVADVEVAGEDGDGIGCCCTDD